MYAILALIIFFWVPALITILRNILHDTYIWQIKEYRVDRIASALKYKETESYRNSVLNYLQIGLLLSTIAYFISYENVFLVIPILTFASYVIEALNRLQDIFEKRLKVPKKSIRNLLIIGFSFITISLPILLPINFARNLYINNKANAQVHTLDYTPVTIEDFFVQKNIETDTNTIPLVVMVLFISSFLVIALDIISPLFVSLFAVITEPLAQYKRRRLIRAAYTKIQSHKGFKVVAITGSFGKTTTKEILYEIIKDNFKVAKTDKNFNSTVGIAESVVKNLKTETKVFIAEMGAYKQGEINKSTQLLQPDISIVTAIGPQHISLFGDINKLVQAKYEIIQGLKSDGLAILNGNNQYCIQMAGKTDKRKLLFYTIDEQTELAQTIGEAKSTDPSAPHEGILYALNIEANKNGYKFKLKYKNHTYPVSTNLTGRHNISNILAAIGAALELGMDIKDIVAKIQTNVLPQVHLNWYKGINNTQILDDGYNTNPEGFKAALDVVNEKPGRKILVTRGILELGDMQHTAYKEIALQMQGKINAVISSDQKLLDTIQINTKGITVNYAKNDEGFRRILEQTTTEGDIILLEGALPPSFINQIILEN